MDGKPNDAAQPAAAPASTTLLDLPHFLNHLPGIVTVFSVQGHILQQSSLSATYFGPFGRSTPQQTAAGCFSDGSSMQPLRLLQALPDGASALPDGASALSVLFRLEGAAALRDMLASLAGHGSWAGGRCMLSGLAKPVVRGIPLLQLPSYLLAQLRQPPPLRPLPIPQGLHACLHAWHGSAADRLTCTHPCHAHGSAARDACTLCCAC